MSKAAKEIKIADRVAVNYPFKTAPGPEEAISVAPGVHWFRMPLPKPLSQVNIWAIEDGDGWSLVDTGLHNPETAAAWHKLFAGPLGQRPIARVFVTHMHRDHVGMAGWLTRKFGCRLWMTRLEYLYGRTLAADTGREAPEDGVNFYRRAGWNEEALETYRVRFGNFGKQLYTLPDSFRRMHDGERLIIGGHEWRVVLCSGHSPEHACLYCPALKLLISGDQVLPRISSNISVHPTEPEADPVSDWLDSIAKLKREVPNDVLVLPGHKEPFRGLHARLDELERDQRSALERLYQSLGEPKRAIDLFGDLFARKVEGNTTLLFLATGESIACLNHLLAAGDVVTHSNEQGVVWYQRA